MDKDQPADTVMIGTDHQPICVPGNAIITILDKTLKVNKKVIYVGDSCSCQFTIRHSSQPQL